MGAEELCDYVHRRLPLRARLAGRERIGDLVRIAITEWRADGLLHASRGSWQEEKILDQTARSVGRVYESLHGGEKSYSFFWTFVIASVISAIVQAMLQWWLSSAANRVKMTAWQYGMRGGS